MAPDQEPEPHLETEVSDDVIGVAFTWSLAIFGVILLLGAGVAGWVLLSAKPPETVEVKLDLPEVRNIEAVPLPKVPLSDITPESGLEFHHTNGAKGEKLLPETMGGGCAFLDYDNDGDQDVLLINSTYWPWDQPTEGSLPATPTSKLFANDGTGHFADVTEEAGIDQVQLYGMGVAVGDYDNDGDPDLFITAVGANQLLRNDKGIFVDVTEEAGVAGGESQWSTSCAWLDYNNDGKLDLFVCNYVHWSKEIDLGQDFRLDGVGRAYGPPTAFDGDYPALYRNDGDGKFTDVSNEAGVRVKNPLTDKPAGKSMGIAPVDYDADGWIDVIVSNDTVQNFVFHNTGQGTFEEVGIDVGVAVGSDGQPRGAMGIDSARHRNSLSLSIAIGNFANEMTSLFIKAPTGRSFEDAAVSTGLGPQTRLELTFGVCFFDVDLDGRQDLLCANGHLEEEINKVLRSQHYEQPPQLFWNHGTGHTSEFVPMTIEQTGAAFKRKMVGRGASFADIDGDGDLDILLTASGGPPRLLRNDQTLGHNWLRVDLEGVACNRDAIGAWVSLECDGVTRYQQVMPARSYLSSVEHPVTFGLGKAQGPVTLTINWPDGATQKLENVEVNQVLKVKQAQ